jgi:hypothetical protein
MGVPNGNSNGSSIPDKDTIPSHFIGGNNLDVAPPSAVKDFVANHGGHSVISSVSTQFIARHNLGWWKAARKKGRERKTGTNKRDLFFLGADRQQRYRRRQGDPLSAEMGLRDIWQ